MKFPKYVVPLSAVGTAVGLFVLFKDPNNSMYAGDAKIVGRTVIVTGASSGIGKETAMELAKRGGRIILACRDLKKCEKVRSEIIEKSFNKSVVCRHLDLGSLKSIREFAKTTNESEKRLDILINNAGVMVQDRQVTEDGFEKHLGVNYLGHFLLTNLLLDKLIASAPSRIINVSSIGYSRGHIPFVDFNCAAYYNHQDAYKQSKMAISMFTYDLAKMLQGKGVTVNAVLPGIANTDLRRDFGPSKSSISSAILSPLYAVLFATPVKGAQSTIFCALEPTLVNRTGKMYSEMKEVDIDVDATDEAKNKRLWAISEKWTRLKE